MPDQAPRFGQVRSKYQTRETAKMYYCPNDNVYWKGDGTKCWMCGASGQPHMYPSWGNRTETRFSEDDQGVD